jgi:IS5 family transposase
MLRDRYDPQGFFTQIPSEFLRLSPHLAQLDTLLDDEELFRTVREALARRRRFSLSWGRPTTPVEVVLRMLVLMRLFDWSFEAVEERVNDSLSLRQFCRVFGHPVPDHTTLIRTAQQLGEETLAALHGRVVELAVREGLTRGRKLRLDTTVVPTNIHPPTDSSLLTDGVRVLSRLVQQAQRLRTQVEALGALGREAFRNRTRSLRQWGRKLRQLSRRKGESQEAKRAAMQQLYAGMLAVARQSRVQAERVRAALKGAQAPRANWGATLGRAEQRLLD